jgi:hypothetical protein
MPDYWRAWNDDECATLASRSPSAMGILTGGSGIFATAGKRYQAADLERR